MKNPNIAKVLNETGETITNEKIIENNLSIEANKNRISSENLKLSFNIDFKKFDVTKKQEYQEKIRAKYNIKNEKLELYNLNLGKSYFFIKSNQEIPLAQKVF